MAESPPPNMSSSRPPTANQEARVPSLSRAQDDHISNDDDTGEPPVEGAGDDEGAEPAALGGIERVDQFITGPQTSERLVEMLQCLIQGNAPDGGVEDRFYLLYRDGGKVPSARFEGEGYVWPILEPRSLQHVELPDEQQLEDGEYGTLRMELRMEMLWPKSFGHLVLQTKSPPEPLLVEPPTVLWGAFYSDDPVWGGLERTILCWKSLVHPSFLPSPSAPSQLPSLPPPPPAAPPADFSSLVGSVW